MYKVYERDILIGTTRLEEDDEPMAIRSGRFYPTDEYKRIQPAIMGLSYVFFKRSYIDPFSPKENEWKHIVQNLRLSITTASGETIDTEAIHIDDFSDDLGEEGIEVAIMVKDRDTYDKFFPQANEEST